MGSFGGVGSGGGAGRGYRGTNEVIGFCDARLAVSWDDPMSADG
jgi:hypothetical protein